MKLKEGTESYRKSIARSRQVNSFNLPTEAAKAAHWKRIDRRRLGWWGVISKKVLPLYEAEAKAIEKAIKGKAPDKLEAIAGKVIDSLKPEWEKVLTAIAAALIEDFGNEIADDLDQEKSQKIFGMTDDELRNTPTREVVCPECGNDKLNDEDPIYFECVVCGHRFKRGWRPSEMKWTFDPMSAAARAWMVKHGTKSIVTILATNLDDVKRVILAGMDENLGTTQIARNLRQFYTDRSPFKAMRVARTETSHAAGFGQREAARQSGVVKTHTWITSRDDRVRDSHVAMDGEKADFNKPYSDGSMYPGEQDIMCRCVESFGTR